MFSVSFSLCVNSFFFLIKQKLSDSTASKYFFHYVDLAFLLFLVAVFAGLQVFVCICFSLKFPEICDKHILGVM